MTRRISAVTVLPFVVSLCFSQQQPEVKPFPSISSWAAFSLGQVAKSPTTITGISNDFLMDKEALSNFDAGIKMVAAMGSHTKGRLHIGVNVYYSTVQVNTTPVDLTMRKIAPNILDATVQSTWGMAQDRDTLTTEFGLFPYKFNPQAQNLGEYLFRSGTYPGVLYSGFETADKVRVCGTHFSYILNSFGRFKQDAFITNELEQYPLHDFNLAYVASYSLPGAPVEIGAGVCFAHLLTLDERKTTPWTDTTMNSPSKRSQVYQWLAYVDSVNGDTTPFTFRGIKTSARITLDPIWFLRPSLLFGKEECKLYGEGAILGLKNYPGWYDDIKERMPVMFGWNLPTFRLLDVLSVEGEYNPSRYWNSPYWVWVARSPVPFTGNIRESNLATWVPKNDDHWKWSVYASRRVNKMLRFSAQIASDHLSEMIYTGPPPSPMGYREVVPRSRDWYYLLRAMIYF
jgi:hypothetical protein